MTGESDGASPYNTESGPAPPQALVAEPLVQKRAQRDRLMPLPLSSQEQMACQATRIRRAGIDSTSVYFVSQREYIYLSLFSRLYFSENCEVK
jgi:hypothetical protein